MQASGQLKGGSSSPQRSAIDNHGPSALPGEQRDTEALKLRPSELHSQTQPPKAKTSLTKAANSSLSSQSVLAAVRRSLTASWGTPSYHPALPNHGSRVLSLLLFVVIGPTGLLASCHKTFSSRMAKGKKHGRRKVRYLGRYYSKDENRGFKTGQTVQGVWEEYL